MNDEQNLLTGENNNQSAQSSGFGDLINYVIAAVLFMIMGAMLTMLFLDNTVSEDELRRIVDELAVDETELRAAMAEIAVVDAGAQAPQVPQVPQRVEEDLSDDDPFWGPEDAAITIVEFSDFFCPFCGRHAQETVPLLQENYGDRVKYVYRDYPGVGGNRAYDTANAAQCAGDQGYYWEYHMMLFENQRDLMAATSGDALRTLMIGYAESLELNMDTFSGCYNDQDYLTDINLDLAAGQRNGVSGTPTFFINGQILIGAQPYEAFANIIDQELAALDAAEIDS